MSKEINIPPFYIGQKVVALRDSVAHRDESEIILKGKTYTIIEIGKCVCCNQWFVGLKEIPIKLCDLGRQRRFHKSGQQTSFSYYGGEAKYFAPILENFQSISLEKILEEETKLISVN